MATPNLHLTTRTIYGSRMQTQLTLGLPHNTLPLSTLNEKWQVHQNTVVQSTERPRAEYYCIGNKGHRLQVGADGIPFFSPVAHMARDAGLYNFLPFVVRPVNEDLSSVERQRYGMRVLINVSGSNYWAYYLKRINLTSVEPQTRKTVITNGVPTVTDFTPDSTDLSPVAPEIPPTGVTTTNGEFLSTVAAIDISFTQQDVSELIAVCQVLYNNELLAAISEIGLVGGIRKDVPLLDVNGNPTGTNYWECIRSVIMSHTTAYYPVGMSNSGMELMVMVGSNEPMFGPTQNSIDPEP